MVKGAVRKKYLGSQTKHSWHKSPKVFLFVALTFLALAFAASFFPKQVDAITSTRTPTACGPAASWTNCPGANLDGGLRARVNVTNTPKTVRWYNYGFNIGNSSTIQNVTVRVDYFGTVNSELNISISNDGGRTYSYPRQLGHPRDEQTANLDVTLDRTWSGSRLSNSNLRVQAVCSSNNRSKATCNIDWIPVTVIYT